MDTHARVVSLDPVHVGAVAHAVFHGKRHRGHDVDIAPIHPFVAKNSKLLPGAVDRNELLGSVGCLAVASGVAWAVKVKHPLGRSREDGACRCDLTR